jgi:hypothetical protein
MDPLIGIKLGWSPRVLSNDMVLIMMTLLALLLNLLQFVWYSLLLFLRIGVYIS